jgi:hypothetical protein
MVASRPSTEGQLAQLASGEAQTVNELMGTKTTWLIDVTVTLLCAFLIIFIIGFLKSLMGLAQRLSEASMFL